MPQVINTNVSSINEQRQLNRSQRNLQISMDRLSSGLRINSVSGQTGIAAKLTDDKAIITLVHASGEDIEFGVLAGSTGLTVRGVTVGATTLAGGRAVTVGGNVSFFLQKGLLQMILEMKPLLPLVGLLL